MSGVRRDKLKMTYAVLNICLDPQRVTHITQSANLNYVIAKPLISELLEKGYLERIEIPGSYGGMSYRYKTTEEGFKIIQEIRKLYDLVGD